VKTELGIVTDDNATQVWNALTPIVATELPIVTDDNVVHPWNAL